MVVNFRKVEENMNHIERILKKSENRRTLSEQIDLIDYKYQKKEKMFYEEFVLLSLIYDSIYFVYRQTEYKIDTGLPDVTSFFIIKYDDKTTKKLIKEEKYNSVFELFNEVRIDGRTIKGIWNEVSFD